ncbi:PRD domain-containing protein [Paenibacillus sp. MER TA 81-3]|uniref:PRD domain-containing protein n=1 Tax=Paenibacillus sp. MER TA 81-3 TaxID=2939573 RepID=UPI002042018A|nr:PRD domain-containing protein [Paenibacillus sp. MER TA 81-3]MCM3337158.1 PRD domain-containing protein [Paenibacillus sp. MER TA 81-3]
MIERKIVHILSHNVVMTKLSTGKNSIAFGKGIGFQRKPGMPVNEADIKQEFLLQTSAVLEHYEHILNAVDFKIIGVVEEVIAFAQGHLEGDFSETIHSALVDHINLAIERTKRGLFIRNPFMFEIQHLYRDEYRVAEHAIDYLNEQLDVELPPDEIAFLAMHFHGARRSEKGGHAVSEIKIISKVLEEGKKIGIRFDESLSTILFIGHVKGLIDRVKAGKTLNNSLLVQIREEYEDAYEQAIMLAGAIADGLKKPVPAEEIGFLTMHLERLVQRQNFVI